MEKGIISRDPEIRCKEILITPLVIRIDGAFMGYINSYEGDEQILTVNRTIPKTDGKEFENIIQKIVKE